MEKVWNEAMAGAEGATAVWKGSVGEGEVAETKEDNSDKFHIFLSSKCSTCTLKKFFSHLNDAVLLVD